MVIKNDFYLHHGLHLFTSVEQHDKYKEHVNNFNNGLHKTGRKCIKPIWIAYITLMQSNTYIIGW